VEPPATVRVGASQETRSHGEAGHGEDCGMNNFVKPFITRLRGPGGAVGSAPLKASYKVKLSK
jgi:hypothetical protein